MLSGMHALPMLMSPIASSPHPLAMVVALMLVVLHGGEGDATWHGHVVARIAGGVGWWCWKWRWQRWLLRLPFSGEFHTRYW